VPKDERPLCEHGDHDDGTPWCDAARDALCNRLQMVRVRLGADFETHGGKKVMFVGSPLHCFGWQTDPPYGTIGTIESTFKNDGHGPTVHAQWDYVPQNGMQNTYHSWPWEYIEVLKTDDDGKILPGEIERASLKIVPRILSLVLPCPICTLTGIQIFSEHGYWQAWCDRDCHVGGPRISDQFPGLMAAAMWNIRGVPAALTKEIRGFPGGDIRHFQDVDLRTLPESPCPWCLTTTIRIWQDGGSKSYHGQCVGCGAFTPWWPGKFSELGRLWEARTDKSPDAVVEGWKRRGPLAQLR
jgi:hypothetical protein